MATTDSSVESHPFQAEVSELLHLLVHSVYSETDIFLQELIDNLGTIARSGTKAFVARLAEAKDGAGLIGQFGVGFYSAFMVADRIIVSSRRAGSDEVWTWSSSGGDGFEIAPAAEEIVKRIARGTEIVLHLTPE